MPLSVLSWLQGILLTPHKAAIRALFPDGSTFAARPDICPFSDPIALAKPLISECLFIAFYTCHVLSLLVFPITMAPPSIAAVSRLLFRLVQSSSWPPRGYVFNTAIVIEPKHVMPNKRSLIFCSNASIIYFASLSEEKKEPLNIVIGTKGRWARKLRFGPMAILDMDEEIQYCSWSHLMTSKIIVAYGES